MSQISNESPAMNDSAALSLLSLSIAASNAVPIPVPSNVDVSAGESLSVPSPLILGVSTASNSHGVGMSTSVGSGLKQHRRLASTGKARRRLSDARDAATRPSPVALQTAAAALSLASLSLSAPPPPAQPSTTTIMTPTAMPMPIPNTQGSYQGMISMSTSGSPAAATAITIKNGKKRGTDHKCESCSKIYRHPSCLIKHRWEHTPHWREASKFVLSKHQQVQLLEAAAILSHLSPSSSTGTSLPEDRSLWPSFLSGGSLLAPDSTVTPSSPSAGYPTSSSVPSAALNRERDGPRLHDYAIPAAGGITQLRPGLLGVPTGPNAGSGSLPVPVPHRGVSMAMDYRSSEPWGSPASDYDSPSFHGVGRISSQSYTRSGEGGGWSLPRSSLRSVSVSSHSRSESRSASRSGSRSDDGSELVEMDDGYTQKTGYGYDVGLRGRSWKKEDDELSIGFSVREEEEGEEAYDESLGNEKKKELEPEWDGLDMEMEMD